VDDSDTGLWYTLDHFTDLVASQPVLPAGQPPAPRPWWRTERDPECYQVFLIEAVGDMRRAVLARYASVGLTRRADRCGADPPGLAPREPPRPAGGLPWWRLGGRLPEALVWPVPAEVGDVLAEHTAEVPLAEDKQIIEAFTAYAAQEALAEGIRTWRSMRRAQDANAAACSDLRERCPVLPVVVADEVPVALVERRGLAQLLGDPRVGRVARHPDVDHAARPERDDEAGEQRTEGQVGDGEVG
jgi:hypothetical protein